MDTLSLLLQGFGVAFQPANLALVFLGCLAGTLIGVLPGLGPISAVALLVPLVFTLKLPPESALILLAGVYYGAMYGGSTTSILLNIPGEAASVVTAIDGHKLAQKGLAGPALAVAAWGSFVAGTLAVVALMLLGPLVGKAALRFGPAEYFALSVFTLTSISALSGGNLAKALLATALGLLLSTVGQDPQAGISRFTLGILALEDGLDFTVLAIGLFAVSEVLLFLETSLGQPSLGRIGRVYLSLRDFVFSLGSMLRGTATGFFVGLLPGAGASVASFLAYMLEKRWLGRRGNLGEGDLRGVAAPEAANNAAAGGAMVPLLTLGLPGSGTTAIMLAALMSLGVSPGPQMLEKNPEIFWGLIASMYVGNLILLLLNLPLVTLFVQVLRIPSRFLLPGVLAVSFAGVYAVNNNPFDLLLMGLFGFLGYFLRKLEIPLPPILLGLVLGYMMEINLRRALILGQGNPAYLFQSTASLVFWALSALVVVLSLRRSGRQTS